MSLQISFMFIGIHHHHVVLLNSLFILLSWLFRCWNFTCFSVQLCGESFLHHNVDLLQCQFQLLAISWSVSNTMQKVSALLLMPFLLQFGAVLICYNSSRDNNPIFCYTKSHWYWESNSDMTDSQMALRASDNWESKRGMSNSQLAITVFDHR